MVRDGSVLFPARTVFLLHEALSRGAIQRLPEAKSRWKIRPRIGGSPTKSRSRSRAHHHLRVQRGHFRAIQWQFYLPALSESFGIRAQEDSAPLYLFFIPLFPVGGGIRFVECDHCGSQFEEAVL